MNHASRRRDLVWLMSVSLNLVQNVGEPFREQTGTAHTVKSASL